MDFLQQILPKDLVNIIEGYYYDPWKEKYNDVISEMNNAKYLDDIFNPMNQNNFWFYGYPTAYIFNMEDDILLLPGVRKTRI